MRRFTTSISMVGLALAGHSVIFAANAFGQTSPSQISLKDAVRLALDQSLENEAATIAVEQARLDQSLTSYGSDPKISLSASASTRWQGRTSKTPASTRQLSRDDALGAQLAYTLWDFGRQNTREAKSQASVENRVLAKTETGERTSWLVVRSYIGMVAAERIVAASSEQTQVAQTRLKEQKRNYAAGLRPESDVVTAEVDLGRALLTEQTARDEAKVARLKLARLVDPRGTSLSESKDDSRFAVKVAGIASLNPEAWRKHLAALGEEQATATVQRLAQERESATIELSAIRASQRPTVAMTLGAQYSSEGGEFTPLRPVASAALALNWDLPWNGQAKDEEAKIALSVRELERQVASDKLARLDKITIAERRLELAALNYRALDAQHELVRKQRRLVDARYQGGNATALEVSAVDSALASMRIERAKLANTVADAMTDVAESRGRMDLNWIEQL